MSLFSALSLGTRSMQAQQRAMEVTGHNLANVNTESYSRQRVAFVSGNPQTILTPSGSFQLGTGVDVSSVDRIHDDFLEAQIQSEAQDLGYYQTQYSNYKILETSFNEPSDSGIANALDEFWQSWKKVAAPNPGDKGAREEVKVKAVQLTDTLKQTYNKLVDLQKNIDSAIGTKVIEINSNLNKIASLNNQIANVPIDADANDLLDKRDQILIDLSKQINFTATLQANRTIDISTAGIPLVVDNKALLLSTGVTSKSLFLEIRDSSNININSSINNGEIAGLLNLRDTVIEEYKKDLNTLSSKIISEVNEVHHQGYDLNGAKGIDFFLGDSASNITLHPSIKGNVTYIAASSTKENTNGNGEIADKISGLQNKSLLDNNTYTVSEFFQNIISKQANDSSYSKKLVEGQETLLNGLKGRKASTSGVSIDEEMTNLVQYEQSYNAAAKYVSTINQVIDSLMQMI